VYGESTDPLEIDVTGDIDGEYAGEVSYKRDGLSGVMAGVSLPQKFYRDARDLLAGLFQQYHLRAFARLNFYRRHPVNFREYLAPESFVVDFSTIVVDDDSVEIKCVSDDINSYVEANKGTKYDLPVAQLKEGKQWKYDRIVLKEQGTYDLTDVPGDNVPVDYNNMQPYVYLASTELSGNALHAFRSQEFVSSMGMASNGKENWFFKAGKADVVSITFSYRVTLVAFSSTPAGPYCTLSLRKNQGDVVSSVSFSLNDGQPPITKGFTDGGWLSSYPVNENDVFYFVVSGVGSFEMTFEKVTPLSISFRSSNEQVMIDVIRPDVLLSRLVREMTGGKEGYGASIEWDTGQAYDCRLVAAESVRNFPAANVHTSFEDFRKWMDALGYKICYPDAKTLSFRKVEELYRDNVIMEIPEGDCSGMITSADAEHAYTAVEIGYEVPEYDSVNGRYEVNGKFNYVTGHVAAKPNVLSLVSPYRADSIGIELLCWKDNQYKASTDDQSDNTVFAVALDEGASFFTVDQGFPVEVNGVKLFNGVLSPYHLALANARRIGISTRELRFASTTANRDLSVLLQDISLPDGLFAPFTREIACAWGVPVPSGEALNGVVLFRYKGRTYRGFIAEAAKDHAKETETKLLLHALPG
jgi:hypothetical protein